MEDRNQQVLNHLNQCSERVEIVIPSVRAAMKRAIRKNIPIKCPFCDYKGE